MEYLIVFLEGIITFISPCLLPMLPIYVSYFAGGSERNTSKTLRNALGFVLGFSVMFILMGALAGTVGAFFQKYSMVFNIVTGLIVVFFCRTFSRCRADYRNQYAGAFGLQNLPLKYVGLLGLVPIGLVQKAMDIVWILQKRQRKLLGFQKNLF